MGIVSRYNVDTGQTETFDDGIDYSVEFSAPEPAPYSISKRQFATQAAISGMISQAECEAFLATNTLPSVILGFIASLPTDQQFVAKMKAIGALEYHRDDEIVLALASLMSLSSEQMDGFWRAAYALK